MKQFAIYTVSLEERPRNGYNCATNSEHTSNPHHDLGFSDLFIACIGLHTGTIQDQGLEHEGRKDIDNGR